MLQVKLGTGQGWYSATEAGFKAAAVAVLGLVLYMLPGTVPIAVSYTHLTLPTTPYV